MTPEPHNSVEVFYSYAHEDEKLRDELKKHLSNLKRQGVITDWYDRDISAGKEWDEEIKQHLNSAKVILLLISPDFMDSEYINDVEVKRAMERHVAGEARVIPIVLRPVDWQGAPFSKLQSLPSDVRPVTLWENQDKAFLDVSNGIRASLQDLSDPSVSIPLTFEIPSPPKVGFISRLDKDDRDIVERLQKELAPGINQLVVLWGSGGVGKTAIAAEAVRGLIEAFARRIAWVSADGLENFSLTTLLDGIASQLGHPDLRKLALDLKKEQVRDLVKTAPALIVLDNFETIDSPERDHCIDWLGKPAPCTTLITTRDMIEDARNIPLDVMRPEEANTLLDQLIAQTHEARAFDNLDRDRLIQTAEANPLVLQWIVGQIDLAQDPDEVLDDLQHGEGKAADRVFNRSYELRQLNNGGRAVLLALSLFAPSAARKAVAEVSGFGKESDKKKFREAVKSLSALWLIHTADESKRLAVEGLTRQLTKARLEADPRGKTFPTRFVSRFLRFADAHLPSTRVDYDALEFEKDNLSTAIDLAFGAGDWKSAVGLAFVFARPVGGMLTVRGYWDEALRVAELALASARRAESRLTIANWAMNVATLKRLRGSIGDAQRLYEESLGIGQQMSNQTLIALNTWGLGNIALGQGELKEAKGLFESALAIFQNLRDVSNTSDVLHQLGMIAHYQGEFFDARRLYERSFEIRYKLGEKDSNTLRQLAVPARNGYFEEARLLDEKDSSLLRNLALLAREEGDFEEARRLCNKSLGIVKEVGDQRGIAISLVLLGRLEQDQRAFDAARQLYAQSMAIAKRIGHQSGVAISILRLGTLDFEEGNYEAAERRLNESLVILRNLGDKLNYAECLESMGKVRVAQDKLIEGKGLYIQALKIAETVGIRMRVGSVKQSLGLLAEKQSDKVEAIQLLRDALTIFEKIGSFKTENARRDLKRVEGH
ncbi:MAG: tetratricopeptide repeat protein [Acidobacteriota bacterium]